MGRILCNNYINMPIIQPVSCFINFENFPNRTKFILMLYLFKPHTIREFFFLDHPNLKFSSECDNP